MKAKKLDIIVPVYNEDSNVESLVQRTHKTLTKAGIDYRLIFVDDHSSDKTVSILKKLKRDYPILIHIKEGKRGKAFSILEGAQFATSEYVVMIDGDCQYPPEAIPEMLSKTEKADVIVANRKKSHTSKLRALASRANAFVFGRLLMGLNCDVQSGLKLFKRDVLERIDQTQVNQWSLDMEILSTAKDMGYDIDTVDIDFGLRTGGQSKVNLLSTTKDLVTHAIKLRLRPKLPFSLQSEGADTMRGAGVHHKRQKFITHTTLDHNESAIHTFHSWQKVFIWTVIALLVSGLILNLQKTALIFTAILSTIYFIDVLFNLYLVMKSLYFPPEYSFTDEELGKLKDKDLPMYSVLVPLYREASVLPGFVEAIDKMDWPKDKLDVMLLLEEDDDETQQMAKDLNMPSYIRTVIVPHSFPKTKPKACNYGLSMAKGEYSVIYDAEDIPDVLQLKKAYAAFKSAPDNIFCLQAKLNYHNPHHNLLTRFFTAEYSLWFDLILPGLQSIETSIPLGGTSNHFKTANLKKLQGWDPFNVTEDADLGIRLFKEGYRTAIIDSVTLEEANSDWGNWIRQRSRWIKGYMQTYLVHMRHPLTFLRKKGVHALIFQLVVGGKIAFMLINPILWILTILYFTLYSIFGPGIESLYPTAVFYMAVVSLVFGNFLCLYYYMIGCAKRGHWTLIKFVYFVPFYWLMVSVAAIKALNQLIFKPHFWEKTNHGLHLKKVVQADAAATVIDLAPMQEINQKPSLAGSSMAGAFLVGSSLAANFLNFAYNIYLGRNLSISEFGMLSLAGSFLYLAQVFFSPIITTISHQTASIKGKTDRYARGFLRHSSWVFGVIAAGISLLWIGSSKYLTTFFKADSITPFILFAPVWILGSIHASLNGFLSGSLLFVALGIGSLGEALSKLMFAIILTNLGLTQYIYAVIPLSLLVATLLAFASVILLTTKNQTDQTEQIDRGFFSISMLNRIAGITFLGLDVVLAKIFLSAHDAGLYALIALAGKMVYFFGGLFIQFIVPMISQSESKNENSHAVFQKIFMATVIASTVGYVTIGLFSDYTVPFLFGEKTLPILDLLKIFALGIAAYTISSSIVLYHQSKKQYIFPLTSALLTLVQISLAFILHKNLDEFVTAISLSGIIHLVIISILHRIWLSLPFIRINSFALFDLFKKGKKIKKIKGKSRVLFLNWRDTKHVWAGGAEVYVHEIAKRLVADGNKVTVFCGNDNHSPRNEVIDGVQMVRRGGFFTVYFWAAVYYVFKFRDLFDVIIDCENGIPFFSPLYSGRTKNILVVHHVHQEVFRKHLKFPLKQIAIFLEIHLMPLVYKNRQVIAVSNGTKQELVKQKIANESKIEIVNPGVNLSDYKKGKKTNNPTLVYLGRLKKYKNVDVAIRAFAHVVKKNKDAHLYIAGEGEEASSLQKLSTKLKLDRSITFLGRVTDKQRAELLKTSWIALQPSSFEGWGITVIEANASGTPVIASNTPGLRDSVQNGKTGLLVKAHSSIELSKAISNLLSNKKLLSELTSNSLVWSKEFSWDKQARKFAELLTL